MEPKIPLNATRYNNSGLDTDSYDGQGAMLFIIAVILVYGVAVIGILGFRSGSELQMEDFDKQADQWLKEVEERQRQLDIKSRKSAFTRRLDDLRSELKSKNRPRLNSHVASYLIASIGMKNVRSQPQRPVTSSVAQESGSTSSSRAVQNTWRIISESSQNSITLPITRVFTNNNPLTASGEPDDEDFEEEKCTEVCHFFEDVAMKTGYNITSGSTKPLCTDLYPRTSDGLSAANDSCGVVKGAVLSKFYKRLRSKARANDGYYNNSCKSPNFDEECEETGCFLPAEVYIVEYETVV